MSDVEFITEVNHRRARERELGARWDEIIANREKRDKVSKTAERSCVVVSCMLAGASAAFFGFGVLKAALITAGVAAIFAFGAVAFYER